MNKANIAPVTWHKPNGQYGIQLVLDTNQLMLTFHIDLDKEPTESQLVGLRTNIEDLLDGRINGLLECTSFTKKVASLVKDRDGRCFYYSDKITEERRLEVLTGAFFKKTMSLIGQSKVNPS